jgi:hypothetical protein
LFTSSVSIKGDQQKISNHQKGRLFLSFLAISFVPASAVLLGLGPLVSQKKGKGFFDMDLISHNGARFLVFPSPTDETMPEFIKVTEKTELILSFAKKTIFQSLLEQVNPPMTRKNWRKRILEWLI